MSDDFPCPDAKIPQMIQSVTFKFSVQLYITSVYPKLNSELNGSLGGLLFRPENLKSVSTKSDNILK